MAFQTGQILLTVLLLASLVNAGPVGQKEKIELDSRNIPFSDIEQYLHGSSEDLDELLDDIKHRTIHVLSHGPLFPLAVKILEDIRSKTLAFLDKFNPGKTDEFNLRDRIPCHYHYESMRKEYQNSSISMLCDKFSQREIVLTVQTDKNCFLSSLYHMISHLQTILYHYSSNPLYKVDNLITKLETLADNLQDLSDDVTEKIELLCKDYTSGAKSVTNETVAAGAVGGAAGVVAATALAASMANETKVADDVNGAAVAASVTNKTEIVNDVAGTAVAASVTNNTEVADDVNGAAVAASVTNNTEVADDVNGAAVAASVTNNTEVADDVNGAAVAASVTNNTVVAGIEDNETFTSNFTNAAGENQTHTFDGLSKKEILNKEKKMIEEEKKNMADITNLLLLLQQSSLKIKNLENEEEQLVERQNESLAESSENSNLAPSVDTVTVMSNSDGENDSEQMLQELKNISASNITDTKSEDILIDRIGSQVEINDAETNNLKELDDILNNII